MELICTSHFFKKLKFYKPLRRVHFQLFEKLTRPVQINFKYRMIHAEEVPEHTMSFLTSFFRIQENLFQSFRIKFVIVLHDIIGLQNFSFCLVDNQKSLCVICTGVTLFAPVLHFFALVLHLNCTALS